MSDAEAPSYHDLHITTAEIPRASIFDLPFNVEITCNRIGGWEVWDSSSPERGKWRILGGEFDAPLRLDVAGHVIVDSFPVAASVSDPSGETR